MDDVELSHQSIHAEYRQALADALWNLSRANARVKVQDRAIEAKDREIAELRERIEAARLAE